MRLADDGAAGVEDAGDDGRIDVRHVAFERRGAVHHRHAGEADIVLEDDALARQRTVRGAAHFGLHRPGIERVLVGARPIAGRARVAHRRQIVGQLIDPIVGLERAFQHLHVFGDFALRHAQVQRTDDVVHLLERWPSDGGHGTPQWCGGGRRPPAREFRDRPLRADRWGSTVDARRSSTVAPRRPLPAPARRPFADAAPSAAAGRTAPRRECCARRRDRPVRRSRRRCTAPTSSSRMMRPRSTSTMRLATSSTSSRFCSTMSIERRCFSRKRRQKLADLLNDRRLNAFRRLVEKQQPRQRHERPRQRQDLLLAAGQCAAAAIEQPGQARKNSEHPLDRTLFGLAGVRASRPGEDFRARSGREGCRGPAARRRCRGGFAHAPPSVVTSTPSTTILPPVAGNSPMMVRSSVVLPMPLWPTMPMASPS